MWFVLWGFLSFSACSNRHSSKVNRLNDEAYWWHYRNLDSVRVLAERALTSSEINGTSKAEAYNNLAFVYLARMNYKRAAILLNRIPQLTDNQIELLIADVQMMRLCQRRSANKEFYIFRESARHRLNRISEEESELSERETKRLIYARSEYAIVLSTYFYYVGLTDQSSKALQQARADTLNITDTAQQLNIWYNIGAGGIINESTSAQTAQTEFDYLLRTYMLALKGNYLFFQAQALQAISEHLQDGLKRSQLIADNMPAMKFINPYNMPDTLLAGYLAETSYDLFCKYGDVYQTAGASRTLAECYWQINDYTSALICLKRALLPRAKINQAPDLQASIYEQMSLAYSALNDKHNSDVCRNKYLDLQENTRQDRELEARAEQLKTSGYQLNLMLLLVIVILLLLILFVAYFTFYLHKRNRQLSVDKLTVPLKQWQQSYLALKQQYNDELQEIRERTAMEQLQTEKGMRYNLEQRTKLSLATAIIPLIDRIINETQRMQLSVSNPQLAQERYEYILALVEQINRYNATLTQWIQLRGGQINLNIQSFALQPLFELVKQKSIAFNAKGIDLKVTDTQLAVKADKVLTLFMLNTLADNARKFTPKGGEVSIYATNATDYIEINVADNGCGMDEQLRSHLFENRAIVDQTQDTNTVKSHGFGLLNCKGIIERYKKVSSIFKVCSINVDSKPGCGSRFYFRLPKGIMRAVTLLALLLPLTVHADTHTLDHTIKAYADSVYNSNVNGRYADALLYADSCIQCLNTRYAVSNNHLMMLIDSASNTSPAEIYWFKHGMKANYALIIGLRNECAVAAMALHRWNCYRYNNSVYTKLFNLTSADSSLPRYVSVMQKSEYNKNMAVVMLLLTLMLLVCAWYFLYYRYHVYYRICTDSLDRINHVLLTDIEVTAKRKRIEKLWGSIPHDVTRRYAKLQYTVDAIIATLDAEGTDHHNLKEEKQQLLEQQRRQHFENARLHVSNNVLDNCLSTIKHETMYYPSEIRNIITSAQPDLKALLQTASYYRDFYTILCMQATRQVIPEYGVCYADLVYLFTILRNKGADTQTFRETNINKRYVKVDIKMPALNISEKQAGEMFTFNNQDIDYLVCRQIIREVGETTNARGCGIEAVVYKNQIIIEIILTIDVWNHLKLLL